MFQDFPDNTRYKVVINHEEQYSLWPASKETPSGWKDVGRTGSKQTCLAYIEEVWTDMRPLSVHTKMAEDLRRRRLSSACAKTVSHNTLPRPVTCYMLPATCYRSTPSQADNNRI